MFFKETLQSSSPGVIQESKEVNSSVPTSWVTEFSAMDVSEAASVRDVIHVVFCSHLLLYEILVFCSPGLSHAHTHPPKSFPVTPALLSIPSNPVESESDPSFVTS